MATERGWRSWSRISDTPSCCQETQYIGELLHKPSVSVHFSHPGFFSIVTSTVKKLLHRQNSTHTIAPPLSSRTSTGQQLNLWSILKTCSWPTKPLAVLPVPTSPTCYIPILIFHQHGSKSVRSFLHAYQSDNGTLGSELCSAEKGPDEAVDLFLLGVVFVVIRRNLQLLHHRWIK